MPKTPNIKIEGKNSQEISFNKKKSLLYTKNIIIPGWICCLGKYKKIDEMGNLEDGEKEE
ncbi:MAG: hypothetical protein DRN05_04190 [Thermoplasmata archaeon]|nr:MAG: hypothetical protein DRN05_04190 [Thermoplasmata archaeon]